MYTDLTVVLYIYITYRLPYIGVIVVSCIRLYIYIEYTRATYQVDDGMGTACSLKPRVAVSLVCLLRGSTPKHERWETDSTVPTNQRWVVIVYDGDPTL